MHFTYSFDFLHLNFQMGQEYSFQQSLSDLHIFHIQTIHFLVTLIDRKYTQICQRVYLSYLIT